MRKGWFKIDGVQQGDRTLEDQMAAVRPALKGARGKTVLDIGCAEGLISREFAKAGATVFGFDTQLGHLKVAREVCAGLPVRFMQIDLAKASVDKTRYDIVLALAVIQKLEHPDIGVKFAARSCASLLLIRSGSRGRRGLIHSKRIPTNVCDSHTLLVAEGFDLETVVPGGKEFPEEVEYWRRVRG